MDSIDYEILRILQEDARISMKSLGEEVGLTAPAVSERVKKLENKGIIKGYSAVVDPEKLGKSIQALVHVAMKAKHREHFVEFIENHSNIIYCYHVTGSYSMVILGIFEEVKELENLITEIQEFGNTNTLMILSSPIERKVIL